MVDEIGELRVYIEKERETASDRERERETWSVSRKVQAIHSIDLVGMLRGFGRDE